MCDINNVHCIDDGQESIAAKSEVTSPESTAEPAAESADDQTLNSSNPSKIAKLLQKLFKKHGN